MYKITKYRKIFVVRFLAFFFIQIGLVTLLLILEPVVNEEAKYQLNQLFGVKHTLPQVITSNNNDASLASQTSPGKAKSGFGDLEASGDIIVPKDTDFGIVIEKLNANAKVVPNVDPTNERDYSQALGKGVAHAKGTVFPGQKGNIYLFSHSVDAPWNIVRFNAIFYLLGKLEKGDRIIMFYQGRRYDYIVFDKAIVSPSDTHFLTDSYDESVLTLQTCDPPGTLLNRLVVRARLVGG
ncbi:MAG: sortase [Candidatus Daviesbacteria bacterium]|nr:sortase [Candidatus Daviesbacteria bacterium]